MLKTKLKKGNILVAKPSIIGDIVFQKSVVLIADNCHVNGSIGFIMNKPMLYNLCDLIPKITKEFEIFKGGPVEKDSLYFMHKVPKLIPKSVEIFPNIYWGGSFNTVIDLIMERRIQTEDIKFFLGYSRWSSGDLEKEIDSKQAWLPVKSNFKNILAEPMVSFWKEQMLNLGGEYSLWANSPKNPLCN